MFISMRETRPKISIALSTVKSEVCDVGAKLEYERTCNPLKVRACPPLKMGDM